MSSPSHSVPQTALTSPPICLDTGDLLPTTPNHRVRPAFAAARFILTMVLTNVCQPTLSCPTLLLAATDYAPTDRDPLAVCSLSVIDWPLLPGVFASEEVGEIDVIQVDDCNDDLDSSSDTSKIDPEFYSQTNNKDFTSYFVTSPNKNPAQHPPCSLTPRVARELDSIAAPTILATNVRSAFNKSESIATEIIEEGVDLAFLTEV